MTDILPRSTLSAMSVKDTADTPLWEILVPTADNEGKPFTVRRHREWDAYVKSLAGGMTLLGPVRGSWVYEGTDYTERMIPVRIMCTREQIEQICKETARFYRQIEVLAYEVAARTVMIHNPNA